MRVSLRQSSVRGIQTCHPLRLGSSGWPLPGLGLCAHRIDCTWWPRAARTRVCVPCVRVCGVMGCSAGVGGGGGPWGVWGGKPSRHPSAAHHPRLYLPTLGPPPTTILRVLLLQHHKASRAPPLPHPLPNTPQQQVTTLIQTTTTLRSRYHTLACHTAHRPHPPPLYQQAMELWRAPAAHCDDRIVLPCLLPPHPPPLPPPPPAATTSAPAPSPRAAWHCRWPSASAAWRRRRPSAAWRTSSSTSRSTRQRWVTDESPVAG